MYSGVPKPGFPLFALSDFSSVSRACSCQLQTRTPQSHCSLTGNCSSCPHDVTELNTGKNNKKRKKNGTNKRKIRKFRRNEKPNRRNAKTEKKKQISEITEIPSVLTICHGTWEVPRYVGEVPELDPGTSLVCPRSSSAGCREGASPDTT